MPIESSNPKHGHPRDLEGTNGFQGMGVASNDDNDNDTTTTNNNNHKQL